jgi:hypothetical protein
MNPSLEVFEVEPVDVQRRCVRDICHSDRLVLKVGDRLFAKVIRSIDAAPGRSTRIQCGPPGDELVIRDPDQKLDVYVPHRSLVAGG